MLTRILTFIGILLSAAVSAADVLSGLKIDPQSVTVSGVSSGAFMAMQMGVAYSSSIHGVASVAGGPYWCAQGDSNKAQTDCMSQPNRVDVSQLTRAAEQWAHDSAIDTLSNLQRQKIYIYASPKDAIIKPEMSLKQIEFYGHYRSTSDIHFENSVLSAHGFPTLDKGYPCGLGVLPWILNCGYDAAKEILTTIYGPLGERRPSVREHLHVFEQSSFDPEHWLHPRGWVYVPQECEKGGCRLHVALHGCQMNPDFIQDQFVRLSGFNEWAEANRIVVLYPQSAKLSPANPYGCWDWFGFTGADYAVKSGAQMVSLQTMIDRLAEAPHNK
jgi:poly(3-hydroxybutyrate) depolymerase